MSDTIVVALIGLVGTVVTVLASAKTMRKKTKEDLQEQIQAFKVESEAGDKAIRDKLDRMEKSLGDHIAQEEINDIKQRRVRIIRAADEIVAGRSCSKDYVEDIIEDIDAYETWCAKHTEYHNGKGKAAMHLIINYYQTNWRSI